MIAIAAAGFAFIWFVLFPFPPGTYTAPDGHHFSVGGVGIDYEQGPKGLDVKYDCEDVCDQDHMFHNAQDILAIVKNKLDAKGYRLLIVTTSRAPHGRGKVDSDIRFVKQNGEWVLYSKKYS